MHHFYISHLTVHSIPIYIHITFNYIFLKMLIPIHTHITFYHLDDVIVTLRGCVQCPDKVQVFPHSKVLIKPDIFELWYKCLYVPWVCKPIVTTREKGDRGLHFSDVIQWRCRLRGNKKKKLVRVRIYYAYKIVHV